MNIFHAHYEFLKNEADFLLKKVHHGDPDAVQRFQRMMTDTSVPTEALQLKHALQVLAEENGYASWNELKHALDDAAERSPLAEITDQFYPKGYTTYWNIWFAKYSQARKVLQEGKGYLLPFKHQFFIVEEHFVDSIGLPHTMPEWETIGNDWVHPKHVRTWLAMNEAYLRAIAARTS